MVYRRPRAQQGADLRRNISVELEGLIPSLLQGLNGDSIRKHLREGLAIPDFVEDPRASKCPIVFYRSHRNAQDLGCFLVRHPHETTQFDDLGLNRMILSEII